MRYHIILLTLKLLCAAEAVLDCHCKGDCLLYLGHDSRALPEGYHTVLSASRLLRTADAASALTLPARCDTG